MLMSGREKGKEEHAERVLAELTFPSRQEKT